MTGIPQRFTELAKMAALAGAYVALAKMVMLLFGGNSVVGFLWPATGIGFAVVLLGGLKYLPAAYLGALFGYLLIGSALGFSLLVALRHMLTLWLGVWLLARIGGFDPRLQRLGDYLRIVLIGFVLSLVTASAMHIGVLSDGSAMRGFHSFNQRLAGNALGLIVIAPLMLVWRSMPRDWGTPRKAAEAALILGLTFLVGQMVFMDLLNDALGQVARGYWMFLLVTWTAVRLGPHGTVLVLAVAAIQGVLGAQWGVGFFSNDIARTNLSNYFFYMICLSAVGMALTTYFEQQQQATQDLNEYRQHLEQLVNERTAKIGMLNRELEQRVVEAEAANQAKSSFLAKMSHEIRTPINGILGKAYLLGHTRLTEQQAAEVAKIQLSGKHLLGIINDILDISKIEAGKLTLENRNFSVEGLVTAIRAVTEASIAAKRLELEVQVGDLPGYLVGDANRLGQILINYIGNAVKFTDQGRILLAATIEEETEHDVLIRFVVRDTGAGIPKDQMGRLFQIFEQVDNSTTRRVGGTGLGLAINKRLAEQMGGAVGAESEPGQGSTFWLRVRLGKGQAEVARVIEGSETMVREELMRNHGGARVLLAEDDTVNQEVALGMLHEVGLSVELAEDGEKAVEMAASRSYALILMDMQMPRLDGIEATRRIRGFHAGGSLPIIAMTANAFSDDRDRCFAAGMNDFIAKPIDPRELFATLLRWLPPDAGETADVPAMPSQTGTTGDIDGRATLAAIEGVDLELGLRIARGSLSTYRRLLGLFVRHYTGSGKAIRAALESGELAEAQRMAHTLKGAAGSVGAVRILGMAEAVELPLKHQLPDAEGQSRKATEELAAELERFAAVAESVLLAGSDSASS